MDCIKHYLLQFIYEKGNGWAVVNATSPNLAKDIFKQQTSYGNVKISTITELRWFGDNTQLVSEGAVTSTGSPCIILGTMTNNGTVFKTLSGNTVTPYSNILYLDSKTNILYRWDKGKFIEIVSDMAALNIDERPTEDSEALVTSGGVYNALAFKQDELTFDSEPTTGSENPVTSGGVKTALNLKQNTLESGTNIKTVNSNSLLGNGNVVINGITSITTQQDGTVVFTVASGDTYTIDLNHVHPQYLKYELVSELPASPDSGTLYLIAAE